MIVRHRIRGQVAGGRAEESTVCGRGKGRGYRYWNGTKGSLLTK